jgi:hypothetical protein
MASPILIESSRPFAFFKCTFNPPNGCLIIIGCNDNPRTFLFDMGYNPTVDLLISSSVAFPSLNANLRYQLEMKIKRSGSQVAQNELVF